MKRILAVLAFLCAAPQAFATDLNAFREADDDCPYCWPLEIDKLAAMMSDDVLRDLVCRLSSERYTAGALSRAFNLPETQILKRINTLRDWGLVRWEMPLKNGGTPSGTDGVVGAAPGKGESTLRRWSKKYCRNDGACGMDDHFSKVAADYNGLRYTDMEPIEFLKQKLTGLNYTKGIDIGCGAGRYSLLLLQNLPNLKLVCGDINDEMLKVAERYLTDHGQDSFYAQNLDANQLSFTPGSRLHLYVQRNSSHGRRVVLERSGANVKPNRQNFYLHAVQRTKREFDLGKIFSEIHGEGNAFDRSGTGAAMGQVSAWSDAGGYPLFHLQDNFND